LVLQGNAEYTLNFIETDALSESQKGFAKRQLDLFKRWYAEWSQLPGAVA
jgi:4-hydroxy-tetrahydrodipicolinate synthase